MFMENNSEKQCSMYMGTIPNKKRKYTFENNYFSLQTQDIDGARSKFIQKPVKPREVYNNRNDDIEKSQPRVIIAKSVNKPDKQLEVKDIDGARPNINKFVSTRNTNPLNPMYQLPEVFIPTPPSPKFIRDGLQIDDIDGTRTKETFAIKLERSRKIIEKQPIIQPRKKILTKTNNFVLDVSDITCKQNHLKPRGTNPLEPSYLLPTSSPNEEREKIGPIEGNKPSNPAARYITPNFSLETKDIQGAQPMKLKKKNEGKREEIIGAKSGTLKRGMSTKRHTNPLKPKYQYIGNRDFQGRPKSAVQRFDAFIY